MRTASDYWLENIPLDIAVAYVEGDTAKVRNGTDLNHHRDDAFGKYAPTWTGAAPRSFARIGRQEATGTFFLVPPKTAAALQAGEMTPPDLTDLAEPEVVRIELERLPAGGAMMTGINPLTKKTHSSGGRLESAMPWLLAKNFEQVLTRGPMYNLSQTEQAAIERRLTHYTHAIMLRYFTIDLDYPMDPMLLDLAGTVGLNFQDKLDLLRGEFREYLENGVPANLFTALLPDK